MGFGSLQPFLESKRLYHPIRNFSASGKFSKNKTTTQEKKWLNIGIFSEERNNKYYLLPS